jgi:hypothetical protein
MTSNPKLPPKLPPDSRLEWWITVIILLVLLVLMGAMQCRADTRQFLAMCEGADSIPVEHGYCEGYIAAVQAMSGTQGDEGVCVGNTTPQDVLTSVVWALDSGMKHSTALASFPPVDTVSAALIGLYPCGSGKGPLPK